jgi:hypothetical protein
MQSPAFAHAHTNPMLSKAPHFTHLTTEYLRWYCAPRRVTTAQAKEKIVIDSKMVGDAPAAGGEKRSGTAKEEDEGSPALSSTTFS